MAHAEGIYVLIAITALIGVVLATPVVRRVAWRFGFIDQPSFRKVHATPMPRLGGLAIYAGFIVALLVLGTRFRFNEAVGILLGATLVSVVGGIDDHSPIGPAPKLLAQALAAGILIFSGVQVAVFDQQWLNVVVTVIWVVGITNALNFLDNMDGLSAGIAAVASAFFLLLAALNNQYLVGVMSAALLGACIGFLWYNFNPASIFMGDSGSLFIGFILAALGIKLRFPDNTDIVTWMAPVLVLGLPILDTTLVTVSRLRRGVNPLTTAGKDHISHRLARLTGSKREAVLMCYLIGGVFGMAAIFVTTATVLEGYLVGAVIGVAGVAAIWWLEQRVGHD
ncbi:MAG: undecaprenyl/decaprenyl-phosphate alpha-N-acetylglucosaminyl 1-phosphate transferase [Anaerolineae bacterium]|nr:undecaprenyl/decaprenyl-phosphate alpha-N-acetylglucosaminyl 1-phosphate transferase [Anaerolineae bacterium]MCB9142946.1 undecaprenyl/decaprenyl-phosphate alpha-N-acetylglucosaminyl 1-phosphate transferase [Anaerolineales bacterium]MCB0236381.1 undecaprenyl/decaprenyl-phosphate alpha-N-acetylglucosaminyl 1-phosphate transferase [Anaerolineae bacterium]MCB0238505.1 undecaprenyl/decaprenyl-phosphate alpha-N-acetylglucosaminyl 1-phosphate transferase [Anaerolineae bacterium]MCB0246672.1 undeca